MRGRGSASAAFLASILLLSSLRAQEGQGSPLTGLPPGAIVLPSRVFVGDRVDVWIPLDGPGAKSPPPVGEDLELLTFEDAPGRDSMVHLGLRAWKPGSLEIPAFTAGGVVRGPFGLRVESSLAHFGQELRPQRRALLLPGTGAALASLLSSLAALALAAWGFASFLLPRLRRFLRIRAGRRPLERFRRDCALLARRAGSMDCGDFYADLSRGFRAWAASRAHPAFDSLSAAEIAALDTLGADLAFASLSAASGPLSRADLARFAGESYGESRLRGDLQELLDIAIRSEEAFDEP